MTMTTMWMMGGDEEEHDADVDSEDRGHDSENDGGGC